MLHTLNLNRLPYAMRVESGATLVFTNIQLFNLAPSSAYTYSSTSPWRSTGQGTTTWPSIGLAVNATVRSRAAGKGSPHGQQLTLHTGTSCRPHQQHLHDSGKRCCRQHCSLAGYGHNP